MIDSWLIGKLHWHYGQIMHKLAIYDLDRTITRLPTYLPFLIHAMWRLSRWRLIFVPVALAGALVYAAKLVDRAALKAFNFKLFVGNGVTRARMEPVAQSFARWCLESNILGGALARIAADRAEGYRIIIATASFRFYVIELAKLLAVEDVIATDSRGDADQILPGVAGGNCYGPVKLAMVEKWLLDEGIERADAHIRFYSDHVSDRYCLEFADEGFATSPHSPLRALALDKGWPVFDWKREDR